MRRRIKDNLRLVAKDLESSRVDLPLPLKLRTAELILKLMRRRGHFGLFVILGWQRKWHKHLDISDSRQDIFAADRHDIMEAGRRRHRRHDIGLTVNFDGAILIDGRGGIVHSGVFIEGLRPRVAAQRLNSGRFDDLSEQFGFETKVHARHLSAITASYIFRGTTIFTVSEENGAFHIFEGGRIVHRG